MDLEFDFGPLLLVLTLTTFVHWFVLRRRLPSIVDPMTYVALVTTTAITLCYLMLGLSLNLLAITSLIAAFWTGLLVTWRRNAMRTSPHPLARTSTPHILIRVVAVATLVFLAANTVFFASAGIPLLAESPTLAKVESYASGFGLVRRINWGLGVFVAFGLTYLLLLRARAWVVLAYAAVAVVLFLSASKSALLPLLLALMLLYHHPSVKTRLRITTRQRLLFAALLVVAIGAALLVLLLEVGEGTQAINALLVRVLYSSDVMFYWLDPDVRQAFKHLDALDYFPALLNSVTGALRISDYTLPLGSQMVQISLNVNQEVSESLGPNVPFYVKGQIYFGAVGALYAFLVGMAMGAIRSAFCRASPARPLRLCVLGTVVILSPALAIEDGLFMTVLFDFAAAFAIVLLLSMVVPWHVAPSVKQRLAASAQADA
jgi:hypothetical protein